jgi:general secretion pathway protein M
VNHGKQYVERHTVIHLKNSGMGPIAQFLESLEKSEYPLSITRLNIRKRAGEPDSYGPVEIGVSAYDRNSPVAAPTPAASASAGKTK